VLPADFAGRSELLADLDAAAAAGTTLVCAPPGYGKTLVLTDWATRPPPVETAWVTIDGGDNDPRRLWTSVLAALACHTALQATISLQLAVAPSGRADAGALLDSLEHDTSLLSAVGRQRDAYRLQPLLRTYLLADVRRGERHRARLARAPVSTVAPSSTRFG
jgi:ATP/maltotriose-dependent transcriptional regulator MalT